MDAFTKERAETTKAVNSVERMKFHHQITKTHLARWKSSSRLSRLSTPACLIRRRIWRTSSSARGNMQSPEGNSRPAGRGTGLRVGRPAQLWKAWQPQLQIRPSCVSLRQQGKRVFPRPTASACIGLLRASMSHHRLSMHRLHHRGSVSFSHPSWFTPGGI